MYIAGTSKEYVRDHVFLHLIDCKNVLTLPNLYFNLEKLLLKEGKTVDCVEYKEKIFEQQQKIAPAEIKLHRGNVSKLDLKKYDGIFLDLCGTFNKDTEKTFNNIKPNTNVVVTFLLARETKELQKLIDINNRMDSYVLLLRDFGIFVTKYIKYNDGSPMGVFFGKKM